MVLIPSMSGKDSTWVADSAHVSESAVLIPSMSGKDSTRGWSVKYRDAKSLNPFDVREGFHHVSESAYVGQYAVLIPSMSGKDSTRHRFGLCRSICRS